MALLHRENKNSFYRKKCRLRINIFEDNKARLSIYIYSHVLTTNNIFCKYIF